MSNDKLSRQTSELKTEQCSDQIYLM